MLNPPDLPKPAREEDRNCFGIVWFQSESDAEEYAKYIERRGDTKNGGFYHGQPCGRDRSFDYEDKELGQLYAVTTG